jgi:hypothetical protein
MEMIRAIRPTSKASLKVQCLWASGGDVDKAKKLYEFFAEDMDGLPENDPAPVGWVDNAKDMANGIMGWFKDNQETLVQGYEFVQGIIKGRQMPPPAPPSTPLPPINQ